MKCTKKVIWAACFLGLLGCGSKDGADMTQDGQVTDDAKDADARAVEDQGGGDTVVIHANLETKVIQGSGRSIFTQTARPTICVTDAPCPALVLVPDRLDAGSGVLTDDAVKMAEKLRTIVVVYNPPGRGGGGEKSDGEEDFGGPIGQDTLKDVLVWVGKKTEVRKENVGVVALGYGLTAAAGALARFKDTNLNFVAWLIDVEGPPNRCFVTQSPFTVDAASGTIINNDGPGVSSTRCDFDLFTRKYVFPAGTSSDGKGTDGTPNAYICNENAWILKGSGETCASDTWWQQREPKVYLPDVRVHYLRIQFLHDHEQPTRYDAREMMWWVTKGEPHSYQVNNVSVGNPLKGYSEEELVAAGAYLDLEGVGNGYGTDIYDDNGDFKKMSFDVLMTGVLPEFVERIQQRVDEE